MIEAPAQGRCGSHPDRIAVDTCGRCGVFVCGDCAELLGERTFCRSCFHRADVSGRASRTSIIAVVLGAISLGCGLPASVVALVIVRLERRAVAEGRAAPISSRYLDAAFVLALVGLVFGTALILTGAWWTSVLVEILDSASSGKTS